MLMTAHLMFEFHVPHWAVALFMAGLTLLVIYLRGSRSS